MELWAQTHFGQGWKPAWIEGLLDLGVDTIRDSLPWELIETTPGVYDFSIARSAWLDDALDAGLGVSLTFAGANSLYDKGYTVYTDAGRAAFAQFIVATLERYPNVTAIEIGNEYNSNSFVTGPVLKAGLNGRDDYYAKLLAAVDAALEDAGIEVEVIGGATHSIPVDYYADLAELGVLDDLDAVSIHPYTTPPEQLADQIAVLRSVIGEDMVIRVTEFGANFDTLEDAPAYLAKMIAVMGAAGIDSANWYAFARQSWYANMELWDQASQEATPAGETFAVLEPLIENGEAIARIDVADGIYFYTLGENAALVWGTPRSLVLGSGVEAYDLAGNRLDEAELALAFDTPIVLRSNATITSGSVVFGASGVVADSYVDFDLGASLGADDDAAAWSYFAVSGTGKEVALVTMGGGGQSGELWTPYLGSSWLRPLSVTASSVTPVDFSQGKRDSARYAVVERYTVGADGLYTLTGHYDVSDATRDGVYLTVRINGEALLTEHIYDQANGHVLDFTLTSLDLSAGDVIEFEVDSGKNAKGDTTERLIQVLDENSAQTSAASTPETLDYSAASKAVRVDLERGEARVAGAKEAVSAQDVIGSAKRDVISGDAQANRLEGGAGNDVLNGRGGDDVLLGGAGRDRLDGGEGVDTLQGGAGNDRYYIDTSEDGVIEMAGEGTDRVYASASYVLSDNVEQLFLLGRADTAATGNALDNVIKGNAGDNRIAGGGGKDVLTGGKGADTFVFDTLGVSGERDVITDFGLGDDVIALERDSFAALGELALGVIEEFGQAGSAVSAILYYDARTRTLLYDADGDGADPAVELVRFKGNVLLEAGDVILI